MHCIVRVKALKKKYGARSSELLSAIQALGTVIDVEGLEKRRIQTKIAALPAKDSVCLIGGYDLLPTFRRGNPTFQLLEDDDSAILTDAPYGAAPGAIEDEYAPSRIVARIPDGADRNAGQFLALLKSQRLAPRTKTPAGAYEEAAKEFKGAAGYVHRALLAKGKGKTPSLSPPWIDAQPNRVPLLSGRGRVHILLHGADSSPEWAWLYGRDASAPAHDYPEAFSTATIAKCKMRGSIVTFSSCYSAMLDGSKGRNAANQMALACLASGAKVVMGSTRANWIHTLSPYDGLGPALVASFWKELKKTGRTAGEAFAKAKSVYLKKALAGDPGDQPYVLKTVLQAQLYGNPEAML